MAKQRYYLDANESIILKASSVRHGFWGLYTNDLILTTDNIICVEQGVFGNHKTNNYYPLYKLKQAIIGKAQNGEKQLELYMDDGSVEDFAFQTDNDMQLRVWVTAIADRFDENSDAYNHEYYQSLLESTKYDAYDDSDYVDTRPSSDGRSRERRFLDDVAANVLESGNFSARGIKKSVKKAVKQQKKKNPLLEGLKEELGYYDIVDEFTEMGNEFREEFGLKPKMTHAQEKERREAEAFRRKEEAFKRKVAESKAKVAAANDNANALEIDVVTSDPEPPKKEQPKVSLDDQIEALKKLKDLVDAGILTEDEFNAKKKEIMGL